MSIVKVEGREEGDPVQELSRCTEYLKILVKVDRREILKPISVAFWLKIDFIHDDIVEIC